MILSVEQEESWCKISWIRANKVLDRQECDGSDEGSDQWGNLFLEKIKTVQ